MRGTVPGHAVRLPGLTGTATSRWMVYHGSDHYLRVLDLPVWINTPVVPYQRYLFTAIVLIRTPINPRLLLCNAVVWITRTDLPRSGGKFMIHARSATTAAWFEPRARQRTWTLLQLAGLYAYRQPDGWFFTTFGIACL